MLARAGCHGWSWSGRRLNLPPVGAGRRPIRHRARAESAERRRDGAGDLHGVAVTYATVAAGAAVHRRRCAGGRPWSSPTSPITWGSRRGGGGRRAGVRQGDIPAAALGHSVPVRQRPDPVGPYDEQGVRAPTTATATPTRWSTVCAGRSRSSHTTGKWSGRATAGCVPPTSTWSCPPPSPHGGFARPWTRWRLDGEVLRDADDEMLKVRRARHPDAGGLVVASTRSTPRISPAVGLITGEIPEIVIRTRPTARPDRRFLGGHGAGWSRS